MEKKAAKKSTAKKKVVETKELKATSPWAEIAVEVIDPPTPDSDVTTSAKSIKAKKTLAKAKVTAKTAKARKVSEPEAITKDVKVKKRSGKAAAKTQVVASASSPTKVSEPGAISTGHSSTKKATKKKAKEPTLDVTSEIAAAEPKVELSSAFKTLAAPSLPDLQRENRARLMMQTPTKLYFYWSVRQNPYHLLRKAFGDDQGSYSLVLKLTELITGVEEIHRAEAEGNWWFNVEPNGKYEAEIGFYAPNRPYFRIIYSNTIETPRRSPSNRVASDLDWYVSASKFAEVLDVAGFSQDAFDVAMAGDDHYAAEHVTHTAFAQFVGNNDHDLRGIAAEDIRYALMALASGLAIEELRSRISSTLFAILQANSAKIAAGNAMNILTEYFDIDESDLTEHQVGSAVYGASLVHFPRTIKTRHIMPKYAPLSSFSFRQ